MKTLEEYFRNYPIPPGCVYGDLDRAEKNELRSYFVDLKNWIESVKIEVEPLTDEEEDQLRLDLADGRNYEPQQGQAPND